MFELMRAPEPEERRFLTGGDSLLAGAGLAEQAAPVEKVTAGKEASL